MMDEKKTAATEKTDGNDALERFLSREPQEKKPEKKKKPLLWIVVAAVAVAALAGALFLLKGAPSGDEGETTARADVSLSVDENGEHQAVVPGAEIAGNDTKAEESESGGTTAERSENQVPEQNGIGVLMEYVPSQIERVDVENDGGSFFIIAHSETVTDDDGHESEKTVYTVGGAEGLTLQDGKADDVANDASSMEFLNVVSTGGHLSDFGFEAPRATVRVKYTDDTTAVIRVGGEAPAGAGSYVTFGEAEIVYLVADDAVDSFLYEITDMISLTVTPAADDVENGEFEKVTISGAGFPEPIVMAPNTDEAIRANYRVTAPKEMFADAGESADITGSLRGLYADEVLRARKGGLDSATLKAFGLSEPFAEIEAVYPDVTVVLLASKPDENGKVNLTTGEKEIIYSVELGKARWTNTSIEKLTPETVLDVDLKKTSRLSVTVGDAVYAFDVTTTTDTVENDEGEEEEVTATSVTFGGEKLDSDNFNVFFQNLTGLKNVGASDTTANGVAANGVTANGVAANGVAMIITYSYSTGRADDTVVIAAADDTRCPVSLNGETVGAVYRSYVQKLQSSLDALIAGETVNSL